MYWRILRLALLLLSVFVFSRSAAAAGAAPVRACLEQAAAAAGHIELGGDQSAARREIGVLLARVDVSAAGDLLPAITRPSDAARALAAVAAAQFPKDPVGAKAKAQAGAQQLTRIAERDERLEAERQYLHDVAFLGADAVALVPELPVEDARGIIVAGLAETKPAEAWKLAQTWQLAGRRADTALATLAMHLADPDQALDAAARISSPGVRDQTLLRLAAKQPPAEAGALATRLEDPVSRADLVTDAAVRLAGAQPEAGLEAARGAEVCPTSARAEAAAALADDAKAAAIARTLPELARRWLLCRLARAVAARAPDRAEAYLKESGEEGEGARLVLGALASADRARALRLARALPAGDARDAGLAAVAEAMVMYDPRAAADVALGIVSPHWQSAAIIAAARKLAETSADAATSLLGLVSDPEAVVQARGEIAVVVARRDPKGALALLQALPEGSCRAESTFAAAQACLDGGGSAAEALDLARLGLDQGLARRWLLPKICRRGTDSITTTAEGIGNSYWQALGLIDAARELAGAQAEPRPDLDRAKLVRPIVEWEGM